MVPVGNFELTSSPSTNVNVWALLIVSKVIASNTKTKTTLDMTGFTDVRFIAALNFGRAISHILVNGLLQSHRRGRWPLTRTPSGKRTGALRVTLVSGGRSLWRRDRKGAYRRQTGCMVRRFVASENESDRMVCANVFGLRWSTELLALPACSDAGVCRNLVSLRSAESLVWRLF